jgi:putative ABC transport system substrate-binding protein
MRRRQFITLLGGAAVAWPLAARAQQPGKTWRMGFIAHGHERFYDTLFEGLRDLGFTEGQNLIIERRYAEGHAERFPEFAAEMVRLNVDVIAVVTTPAALAVKKANAIDPLNTSLVASLAHPGGNAMTAVAARNRNRGRRALLVRSGLFR